MPNRYVFCKALQGVNSIFNVEQLWHYRRGVEFALKDNLRTPKSLGIPQACFYHVILRIPQTDYRDDHLLYAGRQRAILLEKLIAVHNSKLGCYVPEGEDIRYRVEADPTLSKGEVRFLFGPAIYLPAAGETPLYRLRSQTASKDWQTLGEIYPRQRLVLLSGNSEACSLAVPDWPFAADQSALLILEPGQAPEVEPEPRQSPAALRVRSQGRLRFALEDGHSQRLSLELQPWTAAAPEEDHDESETWTPGDIWPITSFALLRIVGVALPRPSLYAENGLCGWRLGWTRDGAVVRCQDRDAVAWLRVDVRDQLWGDSALEPSDSDPLQPPMTWALSEGCALTLHDVPNALRAQYCAWLRLPRPISLSVPADDWFSFGRGQRGRAAPGLFNDPDALLWEQGLRYRENPEQRWLSRQHLGLKREQDGWRVRLESEHWPVHQLNPVSGSVSQSLLPAQRGEEVSATVGAWWVAGAYLLELG